MIVSGNPLKLVNLLLLLHLRSIIPSGQPYNDSNPILLYINILILSGIKHSFNDLDCSVTINILIN